MALNITLDLALTAIKSLLKYRDRIDAVLSLNKASTGLPFALPPTATDDAPHIDNMLKFFNGDKGMLILELKGLKDEFIKVNERPYSRELQESRRQLLRLYYQANEIQPDVLGPHEGTMGPSSEMCLAYYIVESHRLSNNPLLTRILLSTADTLLEILGENSGLFISNSKTQGIIRTLINEFAVKHDFDDDSTEKIFKVLLSSALISVSENQDALPDKPALSILFASISDVREALGDDFVARLISLEGFQKLVSTYLTHAAEDPSFITKNDLAQKVLAATLKEVGENISTLLDDPKACIGVFEVGLFAAAANVDKILVLEIENKPLLAAVLSEVMLQIEQKVQEKDLFKSIASGEFIPMIYQTVLGTIAANPDKLANTLGVKNLTANLISGIMEIILQKELSEIMYPETLRKVASKSLEILSLHPEFLDSNLQFSTNFLKSVLKASVELIKDGLDIDDLLAIINIGITTAADNVALLKIDKAIVQIVESFGELFSLEKTKELLTPINRRDILLVVLKTIAVNPKVWEELRQKNLIKPLVESVLLGLFSDPTNLLSGPVLVESIQNILSAIARRGRKVIDQEVTNESVKILMGYVLDKANQQISLSIDSDNLPVFLKRVVTEFFKSPFSLANEESEELKNLFGKVLKSIEVNNGGSND
jgi:hypothetical protein